MQLGSTRDTERPGKQFEARPRIYKFEPLPEGSRPRSFDDMTGLSLEELGRDSVWEDINGNWYYVFSRTLGQ